MSKITTTLNEIRKHQPCEDGWRNLLKYLGKTEADDEPIPMSVILDSNDFDDCLWALRCRPDLDHLWRLYAVDCARQVQHLMDDQRSIDSLDVAERHALGRATDEALEAARSAARSAALAAVRSAAWSAAWSAALGAAREAALEAALAAARSAALGVARGAAREAALEKQTAALREMLDTGERPDWSKLEEQS